MSKLAIILCIAIFASATNGLSVREQLETAQKSVNALIDSTLERVKSIVADAKQKSDSLVAQIEEQTKAFGAKISDDVKSRLEKAREEIKRLTDQVKDVDVSECAELGSYLQMTSQTALQQMKQCFVNKRTTAGLYVQNMVQVSDEVLKNLNVLKLEARACVDNVDGLVAAGKALWCTNMVVAKATWTTAKAVPSISLEVAKLTFLLTTLPPSLAYCTTTSALATFYHEASSISSQTQKCIREKIQEVRDNISKATESPASSPEVSTPEPEEPSTPETSLVQKPETPEPAVEATETESEFDDAMF